MSNRDDHDPRDGLVRALDLQRGEEREVVLDRDRVYELNGADSQSLTALGAFGVVPEQDLDIDQGMSTTSATKGSSRMSIFATTNAV
jgi:hypothetical protein